MTIGIKRSRKMRWPRYSCFSWWIN